MGYTTGQFIAFIRRTITDNTARLNTAAVVRSVLERLGLDYFNKESDTLPIGSVSGLSAALVDKADLVGGKVPAAQLPSYVDDVIDDFANLINLPQPGERGKIYVTTADGKQYRWTGSQYTAIGGGGGDIRKGFWNPQTNVIQGTGFALDDAVFWPSGEYYVITATPAPFATTTTYFTNNDSYISVASVAGIGYGHVVTGAGIPANTRVNQVTNTGTVVLNRPVTVGTGDSLVFTPSFFGITDFVTGDELISGGNSFRVRPGLQRANGTGVSVSATVVLDRQRTFPFVASGFWAVDPDGRVAGACVDLNIGAGVLMPTLDPTIFILPPDGGGYVVGKEHYLAFKVMADLRVIYIVKPLS